MSDPRRDGRDFAHDSLGAGTHALDLDGEVHAFTPSLRDAFIERGLLYQDGAGVWRLRTHGFPDLHPDQPLGYLGCCDFCSARPAPWVAPCTSFRMPEVVAGLPESWSRGDWAACDTCGAHIAARRKEALLAHCLAARADSFPDRDIRQAIRRMQKRLHVRFWQHYQGGAVRGKVRPFGH